MIIAVIWNLDHYLSLEWPRVAGFPYLPIRRTIIGLIWKHSHYQPLDRDRTGVRLMEGDEGNGTEGDAF